MIQSINIYKIKINFKNLKITLGFGKGFCGNELSDVEFGSMMWAWIELCCVWIGINNKIKIK